MNLILDWGNTRLKAAIFDNENEPELFVFQTDDYKGELFKITQSRKINRVIISSVINNPDWIYDIFDTEKLIFLNQNTLLPINIEYKTPETLGNDRIANVVAASKLNNTENSLIIDVGTCIKFDLIDDSNTYKGGSISPGFEMRLKALNQNTDKLPLLNKIIPEDLIGNSTEQSIASGVYFGMLEELKGIINTYEARYSNLNIIITGGDAFYFEKALKKTIFAHSFLTLYGLNEILNYNAK